MDSHFWKPFVLPVHAKTIDLRLIRDRNYYEITGNYYEIIEENTLIYQSETVFMALRKGFILLLSFKIPYSRFFFKTIC